MSIELISALVGLILTLMVFSYLIGDNPLFRVAVYLFIGVASGYAATVVWHYVLIPRLAQLLTAFNPFSLVPLILGVTLLAKLLPRIAWIGNFAMAVLVGVGAAAAVGAADHLTRDAHDQPDAEPPRRSLDEVALHAAKIGHGPLRRVFASALAASGSLITASWPVAGT